MPQPPSAPGHAVPDTGVLLARHGHDPHALVQILRELQAQHGWLPRAGAGRGWRHGLGLTLAHVQGVAGFYRFLHTQPVGEYRILFSDNVTDRLLGSQALMADLCRRLGVAPGRVGEDGLVSVDTHLLHRPGRPGPGAAGQPPPGGHAAGRRRAWRRWPTLIRGRVPVAQWPAEWFEVHDHIRRADVLLAEPPAPGAALAAALARGVAGMLAEMKQSNLRGRGGAGFATGAEMVAVPQGAGQRACGGVQRRRRRARHLQGPRAAHAPRRRGVRGHDHRRAS